MAKKLPSITTRVEKGDDGKYRWTYTLNMFTNPAILVTVLKIIVPLFSIPLIWVLISTAIHNEWAEAWEGNLFNSNIKMCIFILVLFLFISLLSYLIVAAMHQGKYIVHFTMDEKELVHATDGMQQKKARRMGALTMLAGAAAGRPSVMGAGALAAGRTTSTTQLAMVRRIKVRRRFNLIKVNQLLNHNQVYVPAEDFDMVLNFIRGHCPKAK